MPGTNMWHVTPTALTGFADMTSWMQTTSGASTVASVFITLLAVFIYPYIFTPSKDAIHELSGLSVLTGWSFFSKRYDFLASNFKRTGEKLFQFHVLKVSAQYLIARNELILFRRVSILLLQFAETTRARHSSTIAV